MIILLDTPRKGLLDMIQGLSDSGHLNQSHGKIKQSIRLMPHTCGLRVAEKERLSVA
jgi:hypothetical protein